MPQTISIAASNHPNCSITLTCTANFGTDLNLALYWYSLGEQGAKQLCKPPLFSVEKSEYHHTTRTWTSRLRIATDSHYKGGTVYCGSGHLWANYTLNIEGDACMDNNNIILFSCSHSLCSCCSWEQGSLFSWCSCAADCGGLQTAMSTLRNSALSWAPK